jgi:hypothetical protein
LKKASFSGKRCDFSGKGGNMVEMKPPLEACKPRRFSIFRDNGTRTNKQPVQQRIAGFDTRKRKWKNLGAWHAVGCFIEKWDQR